MPEKEIPDEDVAKDRGVELHPRSHKRKSLLRPKSSKSARAGAGKGVGVSAISCDDISDNEDSTTQELGSQSTETGPRDTRATKRAKVGSGSNDASHLEELPLDPDSSHDAHNTATFTILEQSPSSSEPQGPGDTWTCAVDGCNYKVYQARKAYSQQMINEHFEGHNFGARDKLDLVLKEGRPHLPIRLEHITHHFPQAPVLTFLQQSYPPDTSDRGYCSID